MGVVSSLPVSKIMRASRSVPPQLQRIALIGNPNCGKTALFNRLTGGQQKVANYAGVTVERKSGYLLPAAGSAADGKNANVPRLELIDLPGVYSLQAGSLDEQVSCDIVLGRHPTEAPPDALLCVVDASHMVRGLRLFAALRRLGYPVLLVLNQMDVAQKQGLNLDPQRLAAMSASLGCPVLGTVAIQPGGVADLLALLHRAEAWYPGAGQGPMRADKPMDKLALPEYVHNVAQDQQQALAWLQEWGLAGEQHSQGPGGVVANGVMKRLDDVLLHPFWGLIALACVLFVMFQAVFSLAAWPMGWIEDAVGYVSAGVSALLPAGMLKSLLLDGVLSGAAGVLVFLPQIVILFFFILVFEESGYLPRAALLMDRVMGSVGLSGRSFIPLLSSFACAVPGIMATRTISDARNRWVTIMVAPLMTCSARLPVYTLLIAAFIPNRALWGGVGLQGVVLFFLYFLGVLSALLVAWVLKLQGGRRGKVSAHGHTAFGDVLVMELPDYRFPYWRNVLIGLWQRVQIFVQRVGGIILALSVVLWFLSSFPSPEPGSLVDPVQYSFAGRIGLFLHFIFAPIGFNWQMCIALVPGLAAREVAVSALGTVYALSAGGNGAALGDDALAVLVGKEWSLATGMAFLTWYVYAPMCFATLATAARELNSRKAVLGMALYLFALAYFAAGLVYRVVDFFTH